MSESADQPALVVETSAETFEQDVFERSHQVPVVVDFWADWCQPCRVLAPLLKDLVTARDGRVALVTANVDACQEAAGQFQVQAIPTVFAVVGGEVVDFFQGLMPQDQLADWLDRLVPMSRQLEARRLESADPAAAEVIYRELLPQQPNNTQVAIGLARVLLQQGRDEEARQVIEELERRGFLEPEAEKIKAQLDLHSMSGSSVEDCRAAAEADPENLNLRLQLAESLAASQQFPEALDICLGIVQQDRHGIGETARQVMVDVFRVLPDDSELVRDYRRKLTMALY